MADPFLTTGLIGLELIGGYFAAENIKETARLNLDISKMNAEYAELDAYDAELDGVSQEAKYQTMVDQTLADQQLAFAAQDIDASFGTAADVVEESKFIAELNKMEIEKQAQDQAAGFKTQARQYRTSGLSANSRAQQKASDVQFRAVTNSIKTGITGY